MTCFPISNSKFRQIGEPISSSYWRTDSIHLQIKWVIDLCDSQAACRQLSKPLSGHAEFGSRAANHDDFAAKYWAS
jgi:hypothetical protein